MLEIKLSHLTSSHAKTIFSTAQSENNIAFFLFKQVNLHYIPDTLKTYLSARGMQHSHPDFKYNPLSLEIARTYLKLNIIMHPYKNQIIQAALFYSQPDHPYLSGYIKKIKKLLKLTNLPTYLNPIINKQYVYSTFDTSPHEYLNINTHDNNIMTKNKLTAQSKKTIFVPTLYNYSISDILNQFDHIKLLYFKAKQEKLTALKKQHFYVAINNSINTTLNTTISKNFIIDLDEYLTKNKPWFIWIRQFYDKRVKHYLVLHQKLETERQNWLEKRLKKSPLDKKIRLLSHRKYQGNHELKKIQASLKKTLSKTEQQIYTATFKKTLTLVKNFKRVDQENLMIDIHNLALRTMANTGR